MYGTLIETLYKNSWRVENTRYHTLRLFVFDIQKSGEKIYFYILGHTLLLRAHTSTVFISIKYFGEAEKTSDKQKNIKKAKAEQVDYGGSRNYV